MVEISSILGGIIDSPEWPLFFVGVVIGIACVLIMRYRGISPGVFICYMLGAGLTVGSMAEMAMPVWLVVGFAVVLVAPLIAVILHAQYKVYKATSQQAGAGLYDQRQNSEFDEIVKGLEDIGK